MKTNTSSVGQIVQETWMNHMVNDESDSDFINPQIDSNRMVYVVKTKYPDGITTKAGLYANATLITVYDSETGNLLESTVLGERKVK